MADFDEELIEIRYNTDLWPLTMSFPAATSATANDGAIPFGSTIDSVIVRTFLGNVQSKNDLSTKTELTTLIDGTPSIANDTQVIVKFQYPTGGELQYEGQKVTVIFELTLTPAATHPYYFQYLQIMGKE